MPPSMHPDHAFASRLQDPNSEPFQTLNDRRRGFVPRSASIHSISPSNPSNPSPPALFTGGSEHRTPDFGIPSNGGGVGGALFNASALQHDAGVDYSVPTQGHVPTSSNPNPNTTSTFNFKSNSVSGDGALPIWGTDTGPLHAQPIPQADGFLAPDMGFDWMNWMSTANVAMGPVEEQYGIP